MRFPNESVFTEIFLKRIKGKWKEKDCFRRVDGTYVVLRYSSLFPVELELKLIAKLAKLYIFAVFCMNNTFCTKKVDGQLKL